MRLNRVLALGASLLVLLGACTTGGGSASPAASSAAPASQGGSPSAAASPPPTIKIGSDGFYEAKLMAEIYGQALEAKGYTVDRTAIGIGARKVSAPALESGQFDLKPEYIGSGLAFYEPGKQTGDPKNNQTELQNALKPKGITVLDYSPAADQNAFVVRPETATQFNLTKMSDLTPVASQLKFGVATDCPTNPVCAAALKSAYSIEPQDVTLLDACSAPMADALLNKTVDVAELCSTGPEIITNGWIVLEDDKATQPADHIAPIVRNDLLSAVDRTKFEKTLNDVSAKIDTKVLAQLYYDVAVGKKDLKDVAAAWLKSSGLVAS